MKKVYFIIAGLCLLLALLIGGSVIIDKQLEKDTSFISDHIDFDKTAQNTTSKVTNAQKDILNAASHIEVTEQEKKADVSKITEHEIILTDIGELQVDAGLSEEEWKQRIDKGITAETVNKANKECKDLYYYGKIDSSLRQLYLEIYICLKDYTDSFYICSVDPDDIDYIFNCVMGDHPEIFYTNGYMYTKYTADSEIIKIEFTPAYTLQKNEIDECNKIVEEYKTAFMKGISKSASDYEKIKYTYEFVILNTEYDLNAPENQNLLSVFMYGKSVCQGYAKAFQYLSSNLGIQSALVVGYVGDNEGHAWNLVKCDGLYYYVDCTWGDSSYSTNSTSLSMDGINYDYLNITTKELEMTHSIENFAEVPSCISNQNNYYVKEGLYFTSVKEDQIAKAFDNAKLNGRSSVELKCSDASVYDKMGKYLLDENHVFDYLPGSMDSLTYMKNQNLYIYSFPVK